MQNKNKESQYYFNIEDTYDGCYRDFISALLKKGWISLCNKSKRHDQRRYRDAIENISHLLWTIQEKNINFKQLNQIQIVNHFEGITQLTTKMGYCEILKDIVYSCVDCFEVSPRCYNLGDPAHREEFIDDFTLSAAINILKCSTIYPMLKILKDKEDVIRNAMFICSRFLRIKKRGEWPGVDRSFKYFDDFGLYGISPNDADTLLQLSYELAGHSFPFSITSMYEELVSNYQKLSLLQIKIRLLLYSYSKLACTQFHINGNKNIWILKAPEACRGVGMRILHTLHEILDCERGMSSRIAQKYIETPLLAPLYLSNSEVPVMMKFDMRIWVLVTSFQPLTAYIYSVVYGRRCGAAYNDRVDKLNNNLIHLSNYSIQKNFTADDITSTTPVQNTEENTNNLFQRSSSSSRSRSKSRLVQKLRSKLEVHRPPNKRNLKLSKDDLLLTHYDILEIIEDFSGENGELLWTNEIWPKICQQISSILIATAATVTQRPRSFEFLGFDVLLDDMLNPWVLEVNMSPAIAHRGPRHDSIIRNMAESLIDIVVDPVVTDYMNNAVISTTTSRTYIDTTTSNKTTGTTSTGTTSADISNDDDVSLQNVGKWLPLHVPGVITTTTSSNTSTNDVNINLLAVGRALTKRKIRFVDFCCNGFEAVLRIQKWTKKILSQPYRKSNRLDISKFRKKKEEIADVLRMKADISQIYNNSNNYQCFDNSNISINNNYLINSISQNFSDHINRSINDIQNDDEDDSDSILSAHTNSNSNNNKSDSLDISKFERKKTEIQYSSKKKKEIIYANSFNNNRNYDNNDSDSTSQNIASNTSHTINNNNNINNNGSNNYNKITSSPYNDDMVFNDRNPKEINSIDSQNINLNYNNSSFSPLIHRSNSSITSTGNNKKKSFQDQFDSTTTTTNLFQIPSKISTNIENDNNNNNNNESSSVTSSSQKSNKPDQQSRNTNVVPVYNVPIGDIPVDKWATSKRTGNAYQINESKEDVSWEKSASSTGNTNSSSSWKYATRSDISTFSQQPSLPVPVPSNSLSVTCFSDDDDNRSPLIGSQLHQQVLKVSQNHCHHIIADYSTEGKTKIYSPQKKQEDQHKVPLQISDQYQQVTDPTNTPLQLNQQKVQEEEEQPNLTKQSQPKPFDTTSTTTTKKSSKKASYILHNNEIDLIVSSNFDPLYKQLMDSPTAKKTTPEKEEKLDSIDINNSNRITSNTSNRTANQPVSKIRSIYNDIKNNSDADISKLLTEKTENINNLLHTIEDSNRKRLPSSSYNNNINNTATTATTRNTEKRSKLVSSDKILQQYATDYDFDSNYNNHNDNFTTTTTSTTKKAATTNNMNKSTSIRALSASSNKSIISTTSSINNNAAPTSTSTTITASLHNKYHYPDRKNIIEDLLSQLDQSITQSKETFSSVTPNPSMSPHKRIASPNSPSQSFSPSSTNNKKTDIANTITRSLTSSSNILTSNGIIKSLSTNDRKSTWNDNNDNNNISSDNNNNTVNIEESISKSKNYISVKTPENNRSENINNLLNNIEDSNRNFLQSINQRSNNSNNNNNPLFNRSTSNRPMSALFSKSVLPNSTNTNTSNTTYDNNNVTVVTPTNTSNKIRYNEILTNQNNDNNDIYTGVPIYHTASPSPPSTAKSHNRRQHLLSSTSRGMKSASTLRSTSPQETPALYNNSNMTDISSPMMSSISRVELIKDLLKTVDETSTLGIKSHMNSFTPKTNHNLKYSSGNYINTKNDKPSVVGEILTDTVPRKVKSILNGLTADDITDLDWDF